MIKGCILPWIHLHGDVKGNYHLCCHIPPSSNPIGNHTEPISTIFNNDAYKEVRKLFLSGKAPDVCKKACYDVEALGGESNRQQVNKRFGKFAKLQDYTNKEGSVSNNPIYLDIRFGNKCNFKCRICGPFASSAWFKDVKKVTKFNNHPYQLEDYYKEAPDFWNYLNKIKDSVRHFYFAGGEPLLMDGHYKLLDWLIKNNKTDVELTYNTNLSTLTYKSYDIFNMWQEFDSVKLWPSVDGYKDHCRYGRTNFDWNTFEKNLIKVKKYVDTVSSTVSIYSILTTPELIIYFKNLNISTYLNTLDNPTFMDIRLLPKNIKIKITKKFNLLKRKMPLNKDEIINIDSNVKYLNNNIENKEFLLKQFKQFNSEVDQINKTSFTKTYPELAEWYETI